MKIGILTSSRADFGIYLPLLKELKRDNFFELNLIAFGTHLSSYHGKTINEITGAGFNVEYQIESMLLTDSEESISTAIGLTIIKFADFWKSHLSDFDVVFCLGDRYEMFAAVTAAIPFNIPMAHLHGGETTLGAIDNVFRHAISLASKYHFVSTELYAQRLTDIMGSNDHIHYVGALGLANLAGIKILSVDEFKHRWNIDLSNKTILTTFHPETVNADSNARFARELVAVIINNPQYQFLITLPNADTSGSVIREIMMESLQKMDRVFLIENLGSQSYFSAMTHCNFLLGNTSSGIIEAASFGKYVINIGDRQKGRATGGNVIHVPVNRDKIQQAIDRLESDGVYSGSNIYYRDQSVTQIITALKLIRPHAK